MLLEDDSDRFMGNRFDNILLDRFFLEQTFVDTYSKVAMCKLYTTKKPIAAADLLNDRVVPYFESYRGTEYCGKAESHDYQLFLAIQDIEHTKTKARHPQTNGICERFHKTILNEFYQMAFRKKLYKTVEELQIDLDEWPNEEEMN